MSQSMMCIMDICTCEIYLLVGWSSIYVSIFQIRNELVPEQVLVCIQASNTSYENDCFQSESLFLSFKSVKKLVTTSLKPGKNYFQSL